jgi:hypothetical protein
MAQYFNLQLIVLARVIDKGCNPREGASTEASGPLVRTLALKQLSPLFPGVALGKIKIFFLNLFG